MKLADEVNSMHEAKVNGSKMISGMLDAIKKEDNKKLLKFMAMDKKNFFSKRNLDNLVDDGEISKSEQSKLSKLSIGVAHALRSMDASDPSEKQDQKKRAQERVKEVEAIK